VTIHPSSTTSTTLVGALDTGLAKGMHNPRLWGIASACHGASRLLVDWAPLSRGGYLRYSDRLSATGFGPTARALGRDRRELRYPKHRSRRGMLPHSLEVFADPPAGLERLPARVITTLRMVPYAERSSTRACIPAPHSEVLRARASHAPREPARRSARSYPTLRDFRMPITLMPSTAPASQSPHPNTVGTRRDNRCASIGAPDLTNADASLKMYPGFLRADSQAFRCHVGIQGRGLPR
jgi:hypothetical protein